MKPHPGLGDGGFGTPTWSLPDGSVVRRVVSTDLEALRLWRNAQQSVLRQQQPLSEEHQRAWFDDVLTPEYDRSHPGQILVAVEEDGAAVSYGGLTNLEWFSHRAELSFLAATERATEPQRYEREFGRFLRWVLSYSFDELGLNRIFTETWASRRAHVAILESVGFVHEGTLRQHVVKDGAVEDALLHGFLRDDWEKR